MANPLIAWIKAREELRCRKESGMKQPWTFDPILAQYRFTNIRRRDDRVSRWIIKNVIPWQEHPEFLEFLALCRWINWPPTIKEILDSGFGPTCGTAVNWPTIIKLIDAKTDRREKAWTGAYMIRADNRAGVKRSKADYIVKDVCLGGIRPCKDLLFQVFEYYKTRQGVWSVAGARHCWGSFMAGQFTDDLTWTKFLAKPKDDYTWAPQGPGSRRGYNRVVGDPIKTPIHDHDWLENLRLWRQEAVEALGKGYKDLTLMDVQNCLCEFDKYERARLGAGRPRSYYRPEQAYQV